MFCNKCNSDIPDGSRFCKYCGAEQWQAQQQQNDSSDITNTLGADNLAFFDSGVTQVSQFSDQDDPSVTDAFDKYRNNGQPIITPHNENNFDTQASASKKKTALIIGIIAGVLVLLIAVTFSIIYISKARDDGDDGDEEEVVLFEDDETERATIKSSSNNVTITQAPQTTQPQTAAAVLTAIIIDSYPNNTYFYCGDSFNTAGMRVVAEYDYQIEKQIIAYNVSKPDMNTPGTKTVTVTYSENGVTQTDDFDISVEAPEISLSYTSLNLSTGESRGLSAYTEPSVGSISWRSSNVNVASVSSGGIVTGVAQGSAVITATLTYNGITYTAQTSVSVTPAASQLRISSLSMTAYHNDDGSVTIERKGTISSNYVISSFKTAITDSSGANIYISSMHDDEVNQYTHYDLAMSFDNALLTPGETYSLSVFVSDSYGETVEETVEFYVPY